MRHRSRWAAPQMRAQHTALPPARLQVRFCTEPYTPPAAGNLDRVYAHLTNYAVNKHNAAFQFNQ